MYSHPGGKTIQEKEVRAAILGQRFPLSIIIGTMNVSEQIGRRKMGLSKVLFSPALNLVSLLSLH